jgi:type IV pilus assembly protein PilZ
MGDGRDSDLLDERPPIAADDLGDRRLSDRVEVTWAVDCETEETFLYASIANISAMGIFVRTTEPLTVGTEVTLRFAPPSLPEAFVLRGHVQWINRAAGSPNPGMGIRFLELTLDDRERIVDAIRTIAYLREEPARN